MRRMLAAAAVSGLCSLAAPVYAQALSTGNPCALGAGGQVTVSHVLVNVGVGGEKLYESDWCPAVQKATVLYTVCNAIHDLDKCKAADEVMCSIPGMPQTAPHLHCAAPAVATVSLVPQPSAAVPPVEVALMTPTPVQVPSRPYMAPQQVAMASSDPPSVIAKPCTPPAGVPASMWSGCWAR